MTDWKDLIVGDRMAVDREFSARVADSEFTSQEWDLIMTATEFRVLDPEDPDEARLVADTTKVEQIVPELETVRRQAGAMSPAGPEPRSGSGSNSGIIDSVKDALGMGGGDDGGDDTDEVVRRADRLTGEYADRLQERLANEGKWEQIRSLAAGESVGETAPGESDDEADPGAETGDGDEIDGDTADDHASGGTDTDANEDPAAVDPDTEGADGSDSGTDGA